MTKDLKEAAQALIKRIEDSLVDGHGMIHLANGESIYAVKWHALQDLKTALKPSKSEVADYLEVQMKEDYHSEYKHDVMMFNQAIEYLRED